MSEAAETPIPEEPSVEAEAASKEDLNEKWGDFLNEEEPDEDAVIDELETPAPEKQEEPEVEVAAKEEVVEEGKAPEPEPEAVETETPTVEKEEPSAVEQPPEEPTIDLAPVEEPKVPEKTPEELEALRTQAQGELRKSYELSSDEAEAMLSEPERVLPELAARVHMQVYEQVVRGVIAQLPQMVTGIIAQDRQVRSSEDEFYTRWPKLKEHKDQVAQVATLWRQLNPQATTTIAVENIGRHAMIALGYTPDGAVEAPKETPVPGAPPPPAPVVSAVPPAPAVKSSNQFEQLADELLIEEEEF